MVIFFAISGFLVSRSWVSDPRVIAFGVKRFLRIMPALVVALLVTALILGPLVTSKGFSEYLQDPFTKVFILNNSVMWTFQGLPGVFTDNPTQLVNLPLWTLAPEVKCYILAALLGSLGFYRRWSGAVVVAIGTLLSLLLIVPLRNAIPGGDRAVAMMFNTQATAREVDAVAGGAAFEHAQVFAAFFLFEILKRLAIHPIQYALVGLALAIFFLLLVSLSEHFGFAIAYAIAAASCITLNGYYVAHVLRSMRRGVLFGLALCILYGLLYVLLRIEDHALLMGSLLVFACVAAAMVATRRVDWYAVAANPPHPEGHTARKPA